MEDILAEKLGKRLIWRCYRRLPDAAVPAAAAGI
jgi:hypothetical protein